jgi:hypothetical protein
MVSVAALTAKTAVPSPGGEVHRVGWGGIGCGGEYAGSADFPG